MTAERHRRRVVEITGLRHAGRGRPTRPAKGASDRPIGASRLAGRAAFGLSEPTAFPVLSRSVYF